MNRINLDQVFNFTFETEEDLYRAERTGYIDAYDCVRIEVQHPNGGSVDFPVKSRDEYKLMMEMHKDSIVKIYPIMHSYDILDYA